MHVFCDSFDHYTTAQLTKKWTSIYATGAANYAATIAAVGRRSTNGLKLALDTSLTGARHGGAHGRDFGSQGNKFVCGFAYTHTAGLSLLLDGIATSGTAATFNPSSTSTTNARAFLLSIRYLQYAQVTFQLLSSGLIAVYRAGGSSGSSTAYTGGNPTLLATTDTGLTEGAVAYLEFEVVLHPSAGTVNVLKDGVSLFSGGVQTGLNTDPVGVASWTGFLTRLSRSASGATACTVDDLYLLNGTASAFGPANNAALGDRKVDALLVTAQGTFRESTPSTGTDRAAVVDESPANEADYNVLETAGHKDTFTFGNCAEGATVSAVQTVALGVKPESGNATLRGVLRVGGAIYGGAISGVPVTSAFLLGSFDYDPSANEDWTTAAVDAAETGYERVA